MSFVSLKSSLGKQVPPGGNEMNSKMEMDYLNCIYPLHFTYLLLLLWVKVFEYNMQSSASVV